MPPKNDDVTPIRLAWGDAYSTDPRNPGSAGMPDANPGLNDPGQREAGGRNEANRESHSSIDDPSSADSPNDLETQEGPMTLEEEQAAAVLVEDRAAVDRWSGEGGSY